MIKGLYVYEKPPTSKNKPCYGTRVHVDDYYSFLVPRHDVIVSRLKKYLEETDTIFINIEEINDHFKSLENYLFNSNVKLLILWKSKDDLNVDFNKEVEGSIVMIAVREENLTKEEFKKIALTISKSGFDITYTTSNDKEVDCYSFKNNEEIKTEYDFDKLTINLIGRIHPFCYGIKYHNKFNSHCEFLPGFKPRFKEIKGEEKR